MRFEGENLELKSNGEFSLLEWTDEVNYDRKGNGTYKIINNKLQ